MPPDNRTLNRNQPLIVRACLLLAFLLLIPSAWGHVAHVFQTLTADVPYLLGTTPEQRKLDTYGDRKNTGYGYLLELVEDIPEEHFFPRVRYSTFYPNTHVVFPGYRHVIDDRLMIGIDIAASDFRETLVTSATPHMKEKTERGYVGAWAFATTWEYDLISAITLYFAPGQLPPLQNFKATLYDSPKNQVIRNRWVWLNQPSKSKMTLNLKDPIRDVYGRGSVPFLLLLENTAVGSKQTAEIVKVEILGKKIDTDGYTLFHREQTHFAAAETSFLNQVIRSGPPAWRQYFDDHINIPDIRKILDQEASP